MRLYIFKVFIIILLAVSFSVCGQNNNKPTIKISDKLITEENHELKNDDLIDKTGTTISERIIAPTNFNRIDVKEGSFAYYLRALPVKPHGTEVLYYDGNVKRNYNVYVAVVNKKIGKKNLHQCADAIMHLRADYFYRKKQFNNIHFNFTNGMTVNYSEWIKGKRVVVKGNKSYWKQSTKASNTDKDFWNYMELIFSYAGTYSLSKELKTVNIKEMQIGDIFIQGGFPGHGVIVVDMVENRSSGEKMFLLAQSYMPAQEIQVLQNPNNNLINPWFKLNFEGQLYTPEWTFKKTDLKRFQ